MCQTGYVLTKPIPFSVVVNFMDDWMNSPKRVAATANKTVPCLVRLLNKHREKNELDEDLNGRIKVLIQRTKKYVEARVTQTLEQVVAMDRREI